MSSFTTMSPIATVVQGLVLIIIIGGLYSLYSSTKTYGGLIGRAIRLLGLGMLLVIVAVLEKILTNFSIIQLTPTLSLIQDAFNLFGIMFLGLGFSRLSAASKV